MHSGVAKETMEMEIGKLERILSRPLPFLKPILTVFHNWPGGGVEEAMFFFFLALFEGKQ